MSLQNNTSAEFIQATFDAFENDGLSYCVLRNYENLPEDHGNDVDILVPGGKVTHATAILKTVAQKHGWKLFANVRPYSRNCALYFFCGGEYLTIDFFTDCHWQGMTYADTDTILQTRKKHRDFWAASAGCESATTLIKELLPWGKVKEKNNARERIQKLAAEGKADFVACLSGQLGQEQVKWLWQKASDAEWQEIEDRAASYRKTLKRRATMSRPFKRVGVLLRYALVKSCKYLHPGGRFVVILGPDGSGKTTIANGVMDFWQDAFHKKPFYMHGDFGVLPRLKGLRKLWAKLRGREMAPDTDFTKKHAGAEAKPHSLPKSLAYLSYYYWGYILGHFKVLAAKAQNRLVVADRYFYDYFFQRGNMKLPHGLLRLMSWFIPRPDVIVFLDADAQAIYARKPELTIEEIERQQGIITDMCKWLPNAQSVDADDGVETTVQRVRECIMSEMSDRLMP